MTNSLVYSGPKNNSKLALDSVALKLLDKFVPSEKENPVKVCKGKNSLFSAVSLALCGSEKLTTELRSRCTVEMVTYEAYYRWQKGYVKLSNCAPEYPESCINCALGEDSDVWTMSALTSVIRRPIQSIYPPVNGKMDHMIEALNTTFKPRAKVRIFNLFFLALTYSQSYMVPSSLCDSYSLLFYHLFQYSIILIHISTLKINSTVIS